MEIKIARDSLKSIIETYYREMEGRNVKVTISAEGSYVGYGVCESLACVTTIKLKEEIVLIGVKSIFETTLSKDNLTEIMSELLESEGFILESLSYDEGMETKGYLRDEYQEAYFKGLNLNVSKINKLKLSK